jgi:hypothetical protein
VPRRARTRFHRRRPHPECRRKILACRRLAPERNAPEDFSLRHPSRDPVKHLLKHLGKRRFKQLLADAAREVNPDANPPASSRKSKLPEPKPPRPTADVIQAQINDLLLTLPPDERYIVMDRLGY